LGLLNLLVCSHSKSNHHLKIEVFGLIINMEYASYVKVVLFDVQLCDSDVTLLNLK